MQLKTTRKLFSQYIKFQDSNKTTISLRGVSIFKKQGDLQQIGIVITQTIKVINQMQSNEIRKQDIKLPKMNKTKQPKKTVKDILSMIKSTKKQIKREMFEEIGQYTEKQKVRDQSDLLESSFAKYNQSAGRISSLRRSVDNRQQHIKGTIFQNSEKQQLQRCLLGVQRQERREKEQLKPSKRLDELYQKHQASPNINKLPTIINLQRVNSNHQPRHKSYQHSQKNRNIFSVPQIFVRKASQRNNLSSNRKKIIDQTAKNVSSSSKKLILVRKKKSISDSFYLCRKEEQKCNNIAIKQQLKQILTQIPKQPKKRSEQKLTRLTKFLQLHNPFFTKINEVIAICMLKMNRFLQFPKNHIIYRQNESLQSMFLIIHGKVKLSSKETEMKRLCHTGESIGQQSFFSNNTIKHSMEKAVSCGAVYLMEIQLEQYRKMTEQMMKYGYKVPFTQMQALLRRNFIIKNWKRGRRQRCYTKH